MLVNDVDVGRLRRLAGLRPQGARVLSLYLDLEPTEFATASARETELTSALDAAARMADESDLEHDALVAVREDIERVRDALSGDGLDAKGARAVAVFACGPADLFEVVKLPQPVATHVTIDDSPWIEPMLRAGAEPRVAVALIDRHNLRILHGTAESLEELKPDTREPARHRTATDDEAVTHYVHAGEALLRLLKRRGFDVLVLGARPAERSAILEHLHPYVRDRLGGEIDVDVSSASVDDIGREAGAVVATLHERKVTEALARLCEGLGRGSRAAGGLDDVQRALDERRVEILLYERGRAEEKAIEDAAEAAVLQDAEVLALDAAEHPDLGPHGGIGAVLRF